jgi:hypothetical protein
MVTLYTKSTWAQVQAKEKLHIAKNHHLIAKKLKKASRRGLIIVHTLSRHHVS